MHNARYTAKTREGLMILAALFALFMFAVEVTSR